MVNIASMSAIAAGTATSNYCHASVVSNNFSQIATAVNSNRLNSENYGVAAVMSQNISTGAIRSTHISNGNVYSSHFNVVTFYESHVNYKSSDGGARFLRIGPTAASLPANGIVVEHYSTITTFISTSATQTAVWSLTMSKGVATRAAFSTTPWPVGEPFAQVSSTITRFGCGPMYKQIKNLSNSTCVVEYALSHSMSIPAAATLHVAFMGAASG